MIFFYTLAQHDLSLFTLLNLDNQLINLKKHEKNYTSTYSPWNLIWYSSFNGCVIDWLIDFVKLMNVEFFFSFS